MRKVKITVLRKMLNEDLLEATDEESKIDYEPVKK